MNVHPMTEALRSAGVKLPPVNKRVWLWLKDHPDHTVKEISVAIKVDTRAVSLAINDLYGRGMLTSSNKHDGHTKRWSRSFSALGKVFELLPNRNKPVQPPLAGAAPAPTPAAKPAELDIHNMKVGEAHALYLKLKEIFG